MFKKALCLIFAFLFSINSFAAIVSDNDGSAFVTKSEFEAMKKDFASQVDNYNDSIDRKIDGAIAAYLSGIKTVTSEPSKILVDNYSEMMWVNYFYVYGRWKQWTNNTTYTQQMTRGWFVPSLKEKRHTFRQADGSIYSWWTQAWTMVTTAMEFRATSGNNGVAVAPGGGWPREDVSGVPVLTIRLDKDAEGVYGVSRLFNFYAMSPHAMSSDHSNSGTTVTESYAWGNTEWKLTSLDILSTSGNEIMKYRVNATNARNGAAATFTDTLTPQNFRYPCSWADDDNGTNADKFETQTQAYITSITTNNYFGTGCTWHDLRTNRNEQNDFLRRMMLGQDNTQQVNTAYHEFYQGERGRYDFSKSTSAATYSGSIRQAAVLTRYYTTVSENITQGQIPVNKAVSFSIPHWPTENLRDLSSRRFKYKNQGLKYGEGFPLRIDNQSNGYLQIKFDSSVEDILTKTKFSNQDLRIDIRKENFLSSETNWVDGYKGLVNPDSTSEPLVTLNGYRYTTTDGKINLTIPIKKDESLWIRIAPWDSTRGNYAKWSNLNMTMNTN